MFKYKEKTAFTYNIQSVVHCRKLSMKQNVDVGCSKLRVNTTGCYTIAACFPSEPVEKCTTFKGILPGLSRYWNFQEKKSRTFQEAWEP